MKPEHLIDQLTFVVDEAGSVRDPIADDDLDRVEIQSRGFLGSAGGSVSQCDGSTRTVLHLGIKREKMLHRVKGPKVTCFST